jgi:hypothetical protein
VKRSALLNAVLRIPRLTSARIILALAVAVVADGTQFLLGPLGWAFADQAIDAVTTIAISAILGFHVLLLPTFVLELIPLVQDLPTWTACVAAVIVLRKRRQEQGQPPLPPQPPVPPERPAIDI